MSRLYLDYAATTPIDHRVAESMAPFYFDEFGNASSVHQYGRDAAKAIDQARVTIAKFLNAQFHEIIFTSGATEGNNLAIQGLVRKFRLKYTDRKLHIVTTSIEHSSVLQTCRDLESFGLASVTYVNPEPNGIVLCEKILNAITDETVLVSVMMANNEVGTIQPIREIGKGIERINEQRIKAKTLGTDSSDMVLGKTSSVGSYDKVYFHTDAVQAGNYVPLNVLHLHVDLLTLSAHKIYGPKGVGSLYVKSGTPLVHIMGGGDQEYSLRPGTYNVPAIVGMGEACGLIERAFGHEGERLSKLRDLLIVELKKSIPRVRVNGDLVSRLPNNFNFAIPGLTGESLMLRLDQEGFAVSTGSACSSGAVEVSHVLKAMGQSDREAGEAIRVTLGRSTTEVEVLDFLKKLEYLSRVLKSN
ncbi:MAG TPA: cysteine desulfurase family protein [Bacteroidota bacterium]|nr:cysteine desulfurase family protein [Bacteroidota bacterium]